jgi:hypothetical protein
MRDNTELDALAVAAKAGNRRAGDEVASYCIRAFTNLARVRLADAGADETEGVSLIGVAVVAVLNSYDPARGHFVPAVYAHLVNYICNARARSRVRGKHFTTLPTDDVIDAIVGGEPSIEDSPSAAVVEVLDVAERVCAPADRAALIAAAEHESLIAAARALSTTRATIEYRARRAASAIRAELVGA